MKSKLPAIQTDFQDKLILKFHMKNEQEHLRKPEGKKPGRVMRCDKAFQEIRRVLKPGLLSFFWRIQATTVTGSLLAQIALPKTLFQRLLTC